MCDRDVIMLQLAAANMHPDDFLINVVSKFQLIPWSSEEFDLKEDDSIRQMNVIAEELLSTLIYILGERFIPRVGEVTSEDCVRNEIIQQLCIQPMAHSQLTKALAEDGNFFKDFLLISLKHFFVKLFGGEKTKINTIFFSIFFSHELIVNSL